MSGAALYLHLAAQGQALQLEEAPERPDGYGNKVRGIGLLPPTDCDGVRSTIRRNRAALIAFLRSGSPAALAVRQEGRRECEGQQRKEAA